MKLYYIIFIMPFFCSSQIIGMDSNSSSSMSGNSSMDQRNRSFLFKKLFHIHVYPIQPSPEAKHKSLFKGSFFIYTALPKDPKGVWFDNPLHCLYKLHMNSIALSYTNGEFKELEDLANNLEKSNDKVTQDKSSYPYFLCKYVAHQKKAKNEYYISYEQHRLTPEEHKRCNDTLEEFISVLSLDSGLRNVNFGPYIIHEYALYRSILKRIAKNSPGCARGYCQVNVKRNRYDRYSYEDNDLNLFLEIWPEHETKNQLQEIIKRNTELCDILLEYNGSGSPDTSRVYNTLLQVVPKITTYKIQ